MKTTIQLIGGTNLVDVVIEENDGSRVEKKISVDALKNVFKTTQPKRYFCMNPMFENYEKAEVIKGLIYGEQNENEVKGLYFVPADCRYMDVAGEKCVLPYPSILFCLYARSGRIVNSSCYTLCEKDMNVLSLESKLYAFPFGNVNPVNGNICWGNNNLGDIRDLESMRSVVTIFFSSESNMDYVTPGKSYAKQYGNYSQFLRTLKEKENFPVRALIPSQSAKTVKQLIDIMSV